MRRNPLLPLALACGALLLGAGPALAATATPQPTQSAAPSVSAAPTATAAAPAPSPTRSAQVVVPKGAPDTGVPPLASGSDDTAVTGAVAAGALALGGVGVIVLRRRTKVRG